MRFEGEEVVHTTDNLEASEIFWLQQNFKKYEYKSNPDSLNNR